MHYMEYPGERKEKVEKILEMGKNWSFTIFDGYRWQGCTVLLHLIHRMLETDD